MNCPACGTEHDEQARFCMSCGADLAAAPAEPPAPPAPPPVAAPPPPIAAPPPPGPALPPPPRVAPAYVPPAPPAPPADPNGLGRVAVRVSPTVGQACRAAFAVAGAALAEGELVQIVVGGRLEGHPALVLLTDRGVLVVDDRPWKPVVERIDAAPPLQVLGWQDDHSASLTFVLGGQQLVVDQILDRALAVEAAQLIRARIGV